MGCSPAGPALDWWITTPRCAPNSATKDIVSRLVQGFLGRPALFEYAARRLESRNGIRDTMGRVLGDLVPPGQALDPRFLAALLAAVRRRA